MLVPLIIGTSLSMLLPDQYLAAPSTRIPFALFLGTTIAISAMVIIARVLGDLNLVKTDLGLVTLCGYAVNDILAWVILSVVLCLAWGMRLVNGRLHRLGAWVGARGTALSSADRLSIGIAFTPSGVTGIVVADIALEYGILLSPVFVGIVVSTIVSSLLVGPWLAWSLKRRTGVDPGDFLQRNPLGWIPPSSYLDDRWRGWTGTHPTALPCTSYSSFSRPLRTTGASFRSSPGSRRA